MKFLLLPLFLVTALIVMSWFDIRQSVIERRAAADRSNDGYPSASRRERGAEDVRLLQEEITVVNQQIRQLNQAWDKLFGDLRAPPDGGVDFMTLEVNARANSIRLELFARNVEIMTDYAARLSEKKSLKAVLISRHEQDSRGIRFIVDAKWVETP
ncbi:MAG: hypothetical protein LBD67_00665 [Candidatus Accumulibacter sp.]|nr:hypothetical protein [Accumulibacter sp.]